jgi:soluble lytic murein transglycosylase
MFGFPPHKKTGRGYKPNASKGGSKGANPFGFTAPPKKGHASGQGWGLQALRTRWKKRRYPLVLSPKGWAVAGLCLLLLWGWQGLGGLGGGGYALPGTQHTQGWGHWRQWFQGPPALFNPNGGLEQAEAGALYRQATQALAQQDYEQAKTLLLQLEDSYTGLNDWICLHLAEVNEHAPNEALVQMRLRRITEEMPYSSLRALALYQLGQSHVRAKEPSKAIAVLQQLQQHYPRTAYAQGALYFLWLAAQQQQQPEAAIEQAAHSTLPPQPPAQAQGYAWAYLQAAPQGRFSLGLAQALWPWRTQWSPAQRLLLAQALVHHQQSAQVATLAALGLPQGAGSAWVLAQSALHQGYPYKAMGYLQQALQSGTKGSILPRKAFLELANTLFESPKAKRQQGVPWLETLNLQAMPTTHQGWVFWLLSQWDEGPRQQQHYQSYLNVEPKGRFAPFVRAELLRMGEGDLVRGEGEAFLKHYPASLEAPALLYAKAVKHQSHSEDTLARDDWNTLVQRYPYTVYALWANYHLQNKAASQPNERELPQPKETQQAQTAWQEDVPQPLAHTEDWLNAFFNQTHSFSPFLQRQLKELVTIGAHEDAQTLVRNVYASVRADDDETLPHMEADTLKAWLLAQQGAWHQSLKLARDLQNSLDLEHTLASRYRPHPLVLQLLYPMHHGASVLAAAQRFGVNPYLVLALIRQESSFNPLAISPAKAVGLMQLLPSTANEMAANLGMGSVSLVDLTDPKTNITLGTAYLATLKQQFNGDPVLMVAAYNAGPGAVKGWLAHPKHSGSFAEAIPYDETRHYVEHVLGGLQAYASLYP